MIDKLLRAIKDTPAVAVTRLWRSMKLGLTNRRRRGSDLDHIIAPEILGDPFDELERLAATPGVRLILEIGASAGDGSTAALVRGALRNPETPELHTIEVSRVRFERLAERYKTDRFVTCHNVSSVPLASFPTRDEVIRFHGIAPTRFRRIPLFEVLRWYDQDVAYLTAQGKTTDAGIVAIKRECGVDRFDLVLIDGSEFTGSAELEEIYGSRFIALDDTQTFKNFRNEARLRLDPAYRCVAAFPLVRNGFAVFERIRGIY